MEQFMNKMYELYLDMLQDSRTDAKTEERYYILIDIIFDSLELNWDKTGLRLDSDNKIISIIKALEPARYERKIKKLQEKENPNSDIDEYECGK